MRNTLLSICFLVTGCLLAQNYNGPESVEWDNANNRWLISNTGSHAILARTQSGTLSTFVANTANGPHGIEILDNVLYACCGSSIKGYDLTTGSQVFNLNLGATFLNGLTTDGDSVLYATDFSAKKIYRINPGLPIPHYYVIASNTTSTPNGIIYDGDNNRCIFVAWGNNAPVKAIDLTTYAITTLTTTTLSNCDGITRDHLGYYYVTSWGNQRMNRFTPTFTGGFTPFNSFILNNPADIDCKFGTIDTVGVPNANNNTCTFIPLAPPVAGFTASDTSICLGDQVTYTNTSTNADTYNWMFTGGDPGSGVTSPIDVNYDTLGNYMVTLTSSNIYGTTTWSQTVHVSQVPSPVIIFSNDSLIVTSTYSSYQWYLDSALLSGATNPVYVIGAGQTGTFYCVVTNNGCEGASNVFSNSMGVESENMVHVNVYPNPVSEHLTVEIYLQQPQEVPYRILDISGKVLIASSAPFGVAGPAYFSPDLSRLANGTYIFSLVIEGKTVNKRIVVNR